MSFRPAPFRHTLLALTMAFAGHAGLAHAEVYQLPSGPLAATLNQIASQAGVTLSIDPALTEGKNSAPVSGDYEAIVRTVRGACYRFDRHADVSIRYASTPSPDFF